MMLMKRKYLRIDSHGNKIELQNLSNTHPTPPSQNVLQKIHNDSRRVNLLLKIT